MARVGGSCRGPSAIHERVVACLGDSVLAPPVPAVERGVVAAVPCLAQPGGTEVPVGTALATYLAQVVPQVGHRGTAPEPVAVVDAVDDQAGLEHEGVRDHRVVLGVGVLLDVEIPL